MVIFVATPILNPKISEVRASMIGYPVLAIEIASNWSSLLTLNLNLLLLIPVAKPFVRIILPFVTFLNHDGIIIWLDLYEITLFI